jgi:hypothetical protein
MKLCKDCRWAVNPMAVMREPQYYDWRCTHPTSTITVPANPVTGETVPSSQLGCWMARTWSSHCGPDGRYWEARQPC